MHSNSIGASSAVLVLSNQMLSVFSSKYMNPKKIQKSIYRNFFVKINVNQIIISRDGQNGEGGFNRAIFPKYFQIQGEWLGVE